MLPPHSLAGWIACASILTTLPTLPALAAPPDAGILMPETRTPLPLPRQDSNVLPAPPERPAMTRDSTVKIPVTAIRLTGARSIPETALAPLVADAIGRELTLADLDAIALRLTQHYRDAGYLLARAYLPAQEIKDGSVEIAMLEGRLGQLSIDNQSGLSSPRADAYLANLQHGEAVHAGNLERDLLLLSDLPGVDVKSTLRPGASVGTTDLDVRLTAKAPYSGSVELDNYGNRSNGEWRGSGYLVLGNLAGLGDSLAIRAIAQENLTYGRLAWQTPINGAGTQAGAAWSQMRYELGKDFADLDAHGRATIGSLYLLHSVIRSRQANLDGNSSMNTNASTTTSTSPPRAAARPSTSSPSASPATASTDSSAAA